MKIFISLMLLSVCFQASSKVLNSMACYIDNNDSSIPNLCVEYQTNDPQIFETFSEDCGHLELPSRMVNRCPGKFSCKIDQSNSSYTTLHTTWLDSDDTKKTSLFLIDCIINGGTSTIKLLKN